jgi:hypothetical protein
MDAMAMNAQCRDKDQKPYVLSVAEMDNYVAFSPEDALILIQSCKLGKADQQRARFYLKHLVDEKESSR